ncbi:stage III sporulation protein AH [Bacillus sp. FJAT-27225]|uniref:SpoIIIAH-like family protein n=1 Tax=Bacillus sp. FJAT-27225 TaxID=1743144 RepID=UPI00080C2978|nr:SpoIIIAH-like family protein [Bacillus sp. FJAT-27225]OCA91053.1 stage III sporulation protein AH [Bacillus sp. FJAT-27225]
MLLKKQTVWLLTMLSLVIVLSVYYVTSDPQSSKDLASIGEEAKEQAEAGKEAGKETATSQSEDGKTIVTETKNDEAFETIRLKITDQRNAMKEEWETVMASTDLPPEKRSQAADKIEELNEISRQEEMLETLLKSTMGYEDALVRADGENIRVTVKSKKEHSAKAANDIIQLVRTEIGSKFTAVEFKPSK